MIKKMCLKKVPIPYAMDGMHLTGQLIVVYPKTLARFLTISYYSIILRIVYGCTIHYNYLNAVLTSIFIQFFRILSFSFPSLSEQDLHYNVYIFEKLDAR